MTRPWSRAKRAAVVVLPVLSLWTVWQLLLPPAPAAAGNMLANPGFEMEQKELPVGWDFNERSKQLGLVSVTRKRASGERALLLRPNSSNPDDWRALNVAQGFRLGPLAGKTITLKASLAGVDGATAVFGAWVVDMRGSIVATEQVTSTSPDYETKTTTLDIPAKSSGIMLIVECQVLGTS